MHVAPTTLINVAIAAHSTISWAFTEAFGFSRGIEARFETGPVVLAVVMYRKSQTVDLMEPMVTGLPDYKDLGHGVQ